MGLHRVAVSQLLQRELRQQRIDILNVHSHRDALLAIRAARAVGVPTIYTCHELTYVAGEFCPDADAALAVSYGVGQFIQQHYHIDPPMLQVVPNGIDFSVLPQLDRRASRHACDFAEGEIWLGFLGRLVSNKNVDGIIRALAHVRRAIPQLRLLIIGEGARKTTLRQLSDKLGVHDFIRFHGWVPREDALRFIASLDIVMLPSLACEGLSITMLEAMGLGVPVLGSDIPSLAGGPLRHQETGWMCTANDQASLNETLLGAASLTEAQRRAMGETARQVVRANYNIDIMCDRLLTAYQVTAARYADAHTIVP